METKQAEEKDAGDSRRDGPKVGAGSLILRYGTGGWAINRGAHEAGLGWGAAFLQRGKETPRPTTTLQHN